LTVFLLPDKPENLQFAGGWSGAGLGKEDIFILYTEIHEFRLNFQDM
jgi:hypothetical protein